MNIKVCFPYGWIETPIGNVEIGKNQYENPATGTAIPHREMKAKK